MFIGMFKFYYQKKKIILIFSSSCGRTGRAGNKGYAVTFISPDQPRIAGEIIKAMENSEALVPAELRALWEAYKTKMVMSRNFIP